LPIHFLPDFLIPCWPEFIGPFFPASFAISSRAFLSFEKVNSYAISLSRIDHTSCLLSLEGLVIVITLSLLLLGFLVVNGVCTRLIVVSQGKLMKE
jgi:hypothetical protein